MSSVIHHDHDRGCQAVQPWQTSNQAIALAKEGLPSGGTVGYEIFDRSDGLAATEFQQKINETRAMEGELVRTIRAINGVRAVRVHLVLPQREPFARDGCGLRVGGPSDARDGRVPAVQEYFDARRAFPGGGVERVRLVL